MQQKSSHFFHVSHHPTVKLINMGAFSLYFLILLFANGPIHVNSAHTHHLEEGSENSFCKEFKAYVVLEIYFKISNLCHNVQHIKFTVDAGFYMPHKHILLYMSGRENHVLKFPFLYLISK